MYYTEFDWLTQDDIEEALPEDGLPPSLVVQELENERELTGLTRPVFQDWLREGRHDCEMALAVLRYWNFGQRGGSHDTEADLFDQLFIEYVETLPNEQRDAGKAVTGELPVIGLTGLSESTIMTHCVAIFLKRSQRCRRIWRPGKVRRWSLSRQDKEYPRRLRKRVMMLFVPGR